MVEAGQSRPVVGREEVRKVPRVCHALGGFDKSSGGGRVQCGSGKGMAGGAVCLGHVVGGEWHRAA